MEFERAIYRVYERSLDGLHEDDQAEVQGLFNSKSCKTIESFFILTGLFLLMVLIYLHIIFVGKSGCLPSLLFEKNITVLPQDYILNINIENKNGNLSNRLNSANDEDDIIIDNRNLYSNNYNHKFDVKKKLYYSSSSSSSFSSPYINFISSDLSLFRPFKSIYKHSLNLFYLSRENDILYPKHRRLISINNSNSSIQDDVGFDYSFSYNIGLLALPYNMRVEHGFKDINITYSRDLCFGNRFTNFLLPFVGGVDMVVMNNIMYTLKEPGIAISQLGSWFSFDLIDLFDHNIHIRDWISFKFNVIVSSLLSFFFVSTTTALLVRILISSGVVLLFPFFYLFQLFGIRLINSRILSLSYPWIGVPMEMLRARNQSTFPFLLAHITRVIIYYAFYEACQIAFSMWFYRQQRPGERELWLFAIMMVWEYYTMIFVRSSMSIKLFPRVSLVLYLLYHFYLYSVPFGFHLLALSIMFFFLVFTMIYCVRKYEIDAFYRGIVNIDQPRMIYNTLPWPSYPISLAPDYSIFMSVDQRSSSVYSNAVPNVHLNNTDGDERRNDNIENQSLAGVELASTRIINPIHSSTSSTNSSLSDGSDGIAISNLESGFSDEEIPGMTRIFRLNQNVYSRINDNENREEN